ncbi:hypothetical protein DFQ28_009947 [Apophysomyces sp. BC1034]|nr:hypothetical protein DFQ30_009836 [Apophysomyces sp. BC1015]KAG0181566.1 hypothetical protein DFQ29_007927 [Apophysomyces sp. BC1021]KAG0192187.1 hypothetical protein DFQ28_009947 [Apophysomyces sp. BC1034]
MGKKPLVSKGKVMRLASEEANDHELEAWINQEPTLDESSGNLFDELCTATREGQLEKTEVLVKNFGAPINHVDDWQCSPLYWACLCGHYEVVKFLLENGAQCDRDTFQGERCLYGALNSDIRNLLLSYKITKAVDKNQPYLQFLCDLHQAHPYHDLTFVIRLNEDLHEFPAHRFVLAARSPFFRKELLSRWRSKTKIRLQQALVDPVSFAAVLRYIYTGQFADLDRRVLENMIFVCRHLDLPELRLRCEEELDKETQNAHRSRDAKETARIRGDFETFLEHLLHTAVHTIREDDVWTATQRYLDSDAAVDATFADIAVRLDDVVFPCHKACLTRSDYFKVMLSGAFCESEAGNTTIRYGEGELNVPLIELHGVPAHVFPYMLEYLYTDRCTIPAEIAYDVMVAADMLLIERLKVIAAITLTNQIKPVMDIYELIRTSITLNVDRLEQWCIRYFADHLDDFLDQPEFHALIRESAHSIAGRQETDSIPVIDDLRYFLSKKYCILDEDLNAAGRVDEEYQDTWTDLEALYNEKLEMLDRILKSLGLEA